MVCLVKVGKHYVIKLSEKEMEILKDILEYYHDKVLDPDFDFEEEENLIHSILNQYYEIVEAKEEEAEEEEDP